MDSELFLEPWREHLVCDTGVFIRLQSLHTFKYDNVHVPPSVYKEIRDHAARQHLKFQVELPQVTDPSEVDIRFARWFAKQTGDIGFLSDTDIDVIALTYMLQRQTGDVSRLRSRPLTNTKKAVVVPPVVSQQFANEKQKSASPSPDLGGPEACLTASSDDEGNKDDTFWISEENIQEFLALEEGRTEDEKPSDPTECRVACVSTDYAVQNVLLQMGLTVLSVNRMRIKTIKRWALCCCGCKEVMLDTSKLFCSHCGNSLLRRVTFAVDDEGNQKIEDFPYQIKKKGLKYSIPINRGGRNGGLILCEDHLLMGGRDIQLRRMQKQALRKDGATFFSADDDAAAFFANNKNRTVTTKFQVGLGRNPNAKRTFRPKK